MPVLSIWQTRNQAFSGQWQALRDKLSLEAHLLNDTKRIEKVRWIIEQVRATGDRAVAELTKAYDGVELTPDQFRVPAEDLQAAHEQLDPRLREALRASVRNVRQYQEAIKLQNRPDWGAQGVRLGVRYRPLPRVGICVPGASAPLVSTVVMTAVPAQVAGVPQIAVISAPSHQGSIHPTTLAVCHELGITEVYRVSGAQAVAALAFGTEYLPKVDKIVGPSNWWGQLAKKEVYGLVDIDSFAGPSEVLILADDSATPDWVAADMLSQAEHAPGSAILMTPSDTFARAVADALDVQLQRLSRSDATRQCVEQFCMAVVTRDLDETVALANEFAAEHLQVQTRDAAAVAERIEHAGAIFIGPHTPVAVGDYYAGPSHTLPTGSSARFFSALCVNDFIKQSSIINYDAAALARAADDIGIIAEAEGLTAHAWSTRIRGGG